MVLYFSGTGNSQFVAIQIAKKIDDEVISINQYLKRGRKASFQSERPFVFVAPTYSWRMPRVVENWILETDFKGSRNAYFILTCDSSCGNAGIYIQKLCEKKGLLFCGLSPVQMPENYLAMFPTPSASECLAIVEKAKPHIGTLAEQIRSGRHFARLPVTLRDKLESGPVNPLFYKLLVHDKGFSVCNDCVSCGKCALRCPLNNIEMTDGKPVWKGNCTHCMACIGGCPAGAIQYKSKSKDRHRHYIMNDSLSQEHGGAQH